MSHSSLLIDAGGRLVARGRFELIRLIKPGEKLKPDGQRYLLRLFAAMTDELYQADTSFHWHAHPDYFNGLHDLWTVFFQDRLVGVTATRLVQLDRNCVVYLDNMNVHPFHRYAIGKHTLGSMLVHEILSAYYRPLSPPLTIVFRTQNPSALSLAYSILPRGVYPRIDGKSPQRCEKARRILQSLATYISPDKRFEVDTSVVRQAYSGCIYGKSKRDTLLNAGGAREFATEYCRRSINVIEGDALLVAVCPTFWELMAAVWSYRWILRRERLSASS